jgi:glycosyltransferase involved in cell wall biosynthesis
MRPELSSAVTPRPLRVAVGLEGLALGGCPINALDLARTIRARGHHVEVFAVDEDVRVSLLPYADRSGFPVTVLPSPAGLMRRARQIHALADKYDIDIVHAYAPWLGRAASLATASSPYRRVVVTNWTMANDVVIAPHTPLIVGTRALQRQAESAHSGVVALMEPPVDLEWDRPDEEAGWRFRSAHGIRDDEICLVIVSRLDRHMKAEGIQHAMRAAAAVGDPRLRLVVVGDGDAFDDLRGLGAEVNTGARRDLVLFTGAMLDPRPAYAAADVVLGMGGSALRALAHAKPLIVLGENGFARTFEPDTVDYFYEAGFFGEAPQLEPVRHLRQEIDRLVDPEARSFLGEYGLSEVSKRFGLAGAAARLERVYLDALTGSTPGIVHVADAAYLLSRHAGQQVAASVKGRARQAVGRFRRSTR